MEAGIRQAKTELSKLIRAALAGEQVVITHRGTPLV
jgi:prevent-host-death family protein